MQNNRQGLPTQQFRFVENIGLRNWNAPGVCLNTKSFDAYILSTR